MPKFPKGYRRFPVSFLSLLLLPAFFLPTGARAANNFSFISPPSPPAASYEVPSIETFVVNALNGSSLDATYNNIVTVGLFNTINPNPPTQVSDPAVTIVGDMGTFVGTGPVSFEGGAVT